MKKLVLVTILVINQYTFGQLTVDSLQTIQQLVQNSLIGQGVQVTNITYNGSPLAIGGFNGSNSNLGFNSGIILASGNISTAIGPNDNESAGETEVNGPSDPDIDQIIDPLSSFDAAILEFDFVPNSDTIRFNYVFASEEYLEYVDEGYSDVFGFFISGPGISGPYSNNSKNIALIPGTNTSVTIDNINDNTNSQFYFNNEIPPGESIQYDGFTKPLQAVSAVQCGESYHLKLVIADAGDNMYDSGVFLEAGSFSSAPADLDFKFTSLAGGTEFYEACTDAELIFSRPPSQSNEAMIIHIAVNGSATPGNDYSTLPDSIFFAPGVDTVLVPFQTFADNQKENDETLTITVDILTICGDTIQIMRTITIKDPVRIDSITSISSLSCIDNGSAQSFISNPSGNVTYTWTGPDDSALQVGQTASIPGMKSGWYYLQVQDENCSTHDSVFIDLIPPPIAALSTNSVETSAPSEVIFLNESQNANSFIWDFGNGNQLIVQDKSSQSQEYFENKVYTVSLIAIQGVCSDTAVISFELIAEPIVLEPNIITANEDHINDYFTLAPQNFSSFEYVILNRWGNVMFEGDLSNPNWDGKTSNNQDAVEGIYFYKYTGVGLNGETKKGEGFFHINN